MNNDLLIWVFTKFGSVHIATYRCHTIPSLKDKLIDKDGKEWEVEEIAWKLGVSDLLGVEVHVR